MSTHINIYQHINTDHQLVSTYQQHIINECQHTNNYHQRISTYQHTSSNNVNVPTHITYRQIPIHSINIYQQITKYHQTVAKYINRSSTSIILYQSSSTSHHIISTYGWLPTADFNANCLLSRPGGDFWRGRPGGDRNSLWGPEFNACLLFLTKKR